MRGMFALKDCKRICIKGKKIVKSKLNWKYQDLIIRATTLIHI